MIHSTPIPALDMDSPLSIRGKLSRILNPNLRSKGKDYAEIHASGLFLTAMWRQRLNFASAKDKFGPKFPYS